MINLPIVCVCVRIIVIVYCHCGAPRWNDLLTGMITLNSVRFVFFFRHRFNNSKHFWFWIVFYGENPNKTRDLLFFCIFQRAIIRVDSLLFLPGHGNRIICSYPTRFHRNIMKRNTQLSEFIRFDDTFEQLEQVDRMSLSIWIWAGLKCEQQKKKPSRDRVDNWCVACIDDLTDRNIDKCLRLELPMIKHWMLIKLHELICRYFFYRSVFYDSMSFIEWPF